MKEHSFDEHRQQGGGFKISGFRSTFR